MNIREKIPQFSKRNLIISSVVLLSLVVLGGFSYLYYKYTSAQADAARLRELAKAGISEEVEQLITSIGRFMDLPANEKPTVATIADKDKLSDQPFFTRAENGDKVIIYAQAKKAILYRPSNNKVIEVSTINLGQNQSVSTPSATPKP